MTDVCRNAGRDDDWTCPGCYSDLFGIGTGTHTCPTCEREIEMEPVCVAWLKNNVDEED